MHLFSSGAPRPCCVPRLWTEVPHSPCAERVGRMKMEPGHGEAEGGGRSWAFTPCCPPKRWVSELSPGCQGEAAWCPHAGQNHPEHPGPQGASQKGREAPASERGQAANAHFFPPVLHACFLQVPGRGCTTPISWGLSVRAGITHTPAARHPRILPTPALLEPFWKLRTRRRGCTGRPGQTAGAHPHQALPRRPRARCTW